MSFVLGAAGLHVLGCLLGPDGEPTKGLFECEADASGPWHKVQLAAFESSAVRSGHMLQRAAPTAADIISLTPFQFSAPATEMLFGQAGFLYAALHANALLQSIGKTPAVSKDVIANVAEALLMAGVAHPRTEYSQQAPLAYLCFGDEYLGAAHGTMGILYVLLHTSAAERPEVRGTVDFIAKLQFASGNFPAVLGDADDRLVHWCHGAPGAVFLYCRAYELWHDAKYLEVANRAGECVWQRGLLRKGISLCHGVAGNGYALLRLWRTTGNATWLARARCFGKLCGQRPSLESQGEMRRPDNPLSLFEGISGAVCFLADLLQPSRARFPGFELS